MIAECPFALCSARTVDEPPFRWHTTRELVACLLFPSRAPGVVLRLRVTGQTLDDVRRELRRRERQGARP